VRAAPAVAFIRPAGLIAASVAVLPGGVEVAGKIEV
jgi:hypothetical protein